MIITHFDEGREYPLLIRRHWGQRFGAQSYHGERGSYQPMIEILAPYYAFGCLYENEDAKCLYNLRGGHTSEVGP